MRQTISRVLRLKRIFAAIANDGNPAQWHCLLIILGLKNSATAFLTNAPSQHTLSEYSDSQILASCARPALEGKARGVPAHAVGNSH